MDTNLRAELCVEAFERACGSDGVGRCYDNARMESFFATLKKEKLYQMDTTKMTVADVF
jgi:hypothetical protein